MTSHAVLYLCLYALSVTVPVDWSTALQVWKNSFQLHAGDFFLLSIANSIVIFSVWETVHFRHHTSMEISLLAFVHAMCILHLINRIKGDLKVVIRIQVVGKEKRRRKG